MSKRLACGLALVLATACHLDGGGGGSPPIPDPQIDNEDAEPIDEVTAMCGQTELQLPDLIAEPESDVDRAHNDILGQQADLLYSHIGIYTGGEWPVYVGTLSASDDKSSLFPQSEDGILTSGPVIAFRRPLGNGFRLQVYSAEQQKQLQFSQNGQGLWTEFGLIRPFGVSWGGTSSSMCDDCLPNLANSDQIDIEFVTRNGIDPTDNYIDAIASGSVVWIDSEGLEWQQLATINEAPSADGSTYIEGFVEYDDYVLSFSGTSVRNAPEVAEQAGDKYESCSQTFEYSGTAWVDGACLSHQGIRDFKSSVVETSCCWYAEWGDDMPPGCTPGDWICEPFDPS